MASDVTRMTDHSTRSNSSVGAWVHASKSSRTGNAAAPNQVSTVPTVARPLPGACIVRSPPACTR